MTAGLAYERGAAGRLAVSTACRNLITLFFQTQTSDKLPEELRGAAPAEVRRVGVVGAGTMGAGIAQLAAFKGCKVVVQEVSQAALDAGLERIKALFRKAVERRLLTEPESVERLAAIQGTLKWEGFDNVDVVVEAALEDLECQASRLPRAGSADAAGDRAGHEHILAAGRATARRAGTSAAHRRHALLQPRSQNAARRGRPRSRLQRCRLWRP